ncbi:MAG: hypothetical protein HN348_26475, partial [Proteobacteria bacterium]|nr:hypothetical protein [Pseudomonadota bacterium]
MSFPIWALAILVSCIQAEPEPASEPEPVFWSTEDVRPTLDHSFFAENSLDDLSLFATFVEGPLEERPNFTQRGPFAIGNGRMFTFIGLNDPVNSMHELVGPIYDNDPRFFGEVWHNLEIDGQIVYFEKEWVARPRGTALAITRGDVGDISLYTLDFAPIPRTEGPIPAIVRLFLVTGHDAQAVRVVQTTYRDIEEVEGSLAEVLDDERRLAFLPWEGDFTIGESSLAIDIFKGRAAIVLATGDNDDIDSVTNAMATSSLEDWLEDTVQWWQDYSAKGVQLDLEDPNIEDLYDGMRVGIRVQQSVYGGVSPMSRYTGVWLRDSIGTTRFYLRAGLFAEAKAGIDYLYWCHINRGDIGNACDSGLTEDQIGEPPDWSAMGGFSGRTGAEGPSYLPLMYRDYVNWTGDWEPVTERWDYLRRALVAQQVDDEGRQTFSGDETFRAAMEAGLGFPIEYSWDELAWSANSSFLMLAAANFMADAAQNNGFESDIATMNDLANGAQAALDNHFWHSKGHFSPFIFHTAGNANEAGEVEERPYEDVNLKPLWIGSHDVDDEVALSNLRGLQEAAGRGDGTVQTPLSGDYQGVLNFEFEEGFVTGMVPGFYLYNLTAIGDPEAEQAFNALYRYASTSGQYAEGIVYDDFSAFQLFYDESGTLGDIVARHRPWEGGINIDAFLFYLIGAEPTPGGMRL